MEKIGTREINTKRLLLRKLNLSDANDMYKNWASDDEVTYFLTWPSHPRVEISKMLLKSWISQWDNGIS